MTEWIPPAAIFIVGAFLIPFLRGKIKQAYLLILPALAFIDLMYMSHSTQWVYNFLGYDIIFGKVDKLSMVFGYVFVIMAFAGALYSLHVKEDAQHIAAFLYVGSALGVVFAGDYLSLFVFWEIMAVSSVFLIWYRRTKESMGAGFRYLLVHITGGLFLLGGIVIHFINVGSIEFGPIVYGGLGYYLILIGFILNAAVPPLSAWLSDAYPEATVTGAVFLSAFTTKTAVYVLLRAFPGADILIWLGAIMAVYGVIFAVLSNDIRRLLSYHIISQVGYMVAGVGLGTTLALNGSSAHAFCHILYKGLLFMGAGAVLYMTGKSKLTELGGIYKTMPITLILYMVGGFSISAFPLFSGFVSKSMILAAAADDHRALVWLMLTLASAGTFLHTGLKLPYFTFFGKDSGIRVKEPPINMLLAMGFLASLCILLGVYPAVLYNLLPYAVNFVPYTAAHVVWTMQIMLFTALGFFLLLKHVGGEPYITLDTDWFYRKGGRVFFWFIFNPLANFGKLTEKYFFFKIPGVPLWFSRNPLAALDILNDKIKGRDTTEKKEKYPELPMRMQVVGPTIIFTVIFLVTYLLLINLGWLS